ncbi:hypothetical protein [Stella sp.]|uniref:hypothetical protein n=1 Tax=Stella sp. TaxID=2912054 RepID=UPI0035AFA7B4
MRIVLPLAAAAATVGLVALGFLSARTAVTAVRAPDSVAAAADDAATVAALAARLGIVEERLRRLEDLARPAAPPPTAKAPDDQPRDDRHLVALLHLQNVAQSARPWQRELQLVLDLAGPDRLNRPLVDVLRGHAAQGVPSRAELRREFLAIRAALLAEARGESGMIHGLLQSGQSAAAGLGLAAPPPPGRTEATVAGIARGLDRGDLAGALHDAALLDARLQPRVAVWTGRVRSRLAVEQAIQELLAQSLAAGPRRS